MLWVGAFLSEGFRDLGRYRNIRDVVSVKAEDQNPSVCNNAKMNRV